MGLMISEEALGLNLVQPVDRGQPQTSQAQAAPEVQVGMNSCGRSCVYVIIHTCSTSSTSHTMDESHTTDEIWEVRLMLSYTWVLGSL